MRPPPSDKRFVIGVVLFIAAVFCVILAVGGAIFWFVFQATRPAADAGDAFLEQVKAGDYRLAYEMLSPGFQDELGHAENLAGKINRGGSRPDTWRWNMQAIENNTARLEGVVTFADGATGTVGMRLIRQGDAWLVDSVLLTENPAK